MIITQIPEPKGKGVTRVSGPELRPGVLDFTAHMVPQLNNRCFHIRALPFRYLTNNVN